MFLEHINITVSDLARSIDFYSRLFGFHVRWQGVDSEGRDAAHVGDDRHYLAFFTATSTQQELNDYGRVGVNHFAFVVPDLEPFRSKLASMGITPHLEGDYAPGKRLYFHDPDGVEVELVTYPTDLPSEE